MSDHPIYDAVLAEQGFDPASVRPLDTRMGRIQRHQDWENRVVSRIAAAVGEGAQKSGYRTPKARKNTTAKA